MLNSSEHEIDPANKCLNAINCWHLNIYLQYEYNIWEYKRNKNLKFSAFKFLWGDEMSCSVELSMKKYNNLKTWYGTHLPLIYNYKECFQGHWGSFSSTFQDRLYFQGLIMSLSFLSIFSVGHSVVSKRFSRRIVFSRIFLENPPFWKCELGVVSNIRATNKHKYTGWFVPFCSQTTKWCWWWWIQYINIAALSTCVAKSTHAKYRKKK